MTTRTYFIETPCPDWPHGCRVGTVRDENGMETPHLTCRTHGEVVGHWENRDEDEGRVSPDA